METLKRKRVWTLCSLIIVSAAVLLSVVSSKLCFTFMIVIQFFLVLVLMLCFCSSFIHWHLNLFHLTWKLSSVV